jgi:hypothetical protein
MLDEIVAVTGWSSDCHAAAGAGGDASRGAASAVQAEEVLHRGDRCPCTRVGDQGRISCGKYLAVAMPALLDGWEVHGELTGVWQTPLLPSNLP